MKHSGKTWRADIALHDRRRLLKLLGVLLAAPFAPAGLGRKAAEILGGNAFAAGDSGARYFVEINLRPQWDLGHLFVAPGLTGSIERATGARSAALFYGPSELRTVGTTGPAQTVYLTSDSAVLEPHVGTIAQIDTCELPVGRVHGHEALGPTRSPGRGGAQGYNSWVNDEGFPNEIGNERHKASVPTPASFFNHYVKSNDPTVANGVAIKGCISPSNVFHVEAGLAGASLDRLSTRTNLIGRFAQDPLPALASAKEAALLETMLKHLDGRFLKELNYLAQAQGTLDGVKGEAIGRLQVPRRVFDLNLTTAEQTRYSEGVDDFVREGNGDDKPELWEMIAYASKMIQADVVRSVAIEYDYGPDIHDERIESQLRNQTRILARPLSKLIDDLKARPHPDGGTYYDRTVIAIYTVDGGRAPARLTPDPRAASPAEYEGKNTVVIAGGQIKGGYYGNISAGAADNYIGAGQRYLYHTPAVADGVTGSGIDGPGGRLPAASLWTTVMEALNVPRSAYSSFSAVSSAAVLNWLLKS